MKSIDNLCMGCMSNKEKTERFCWKCGYDSEAVISKSIYIKPGTIINNYLVGRVLGHGGFGITYIGMNIDSGEVVAIKEYFPTGQTTRASQQSVSVFRGKEDFYKKGIKKFKEEAEMLKRFSSFPGIVDTIDFFECNNTAYSVMEYVEGITLKQYVQQKGGSIPFSHVQEILMPIMDALGEMHRYGIIHRDISPDNIYITVDKRIKLLDFGSARYANNEDNKSLSIIIKHGYAPKEQYYTKGNQGPWTDVYAVAATAYYALTGQTPQPSLERMEKDNVVHPSCIDADISLDEEQVLMVALSIKETDRYQNMKSLQKAILKVQREKITKTKSTVNSKKSNNEIASPKTETKNLINKKVILIAGGVIVALTAIALVFLPNLLQSKSTEFSASGALDEEEPMRSSVETEKLTEVPTEESFGEQYLHNAVVEGDVYTNDYFGLTMTILPNAVWYTQEELAEAFEGTTDFMNITEISDEEVYPLLMCYTASETTQEPSMSMSFSAEPFSSIDPVMFAEVAEDTLDDANDTETLAAKPEPRSLNGHSAHLIVMKSLKDREVVLTQAIVIVEVEEGTLIITYKYCSREEEQYAIDSVFSISFSD